MPGCESSRAFFMMASAAAWRRVSAVACGRTGWRSLRYIVGPELHRTPGETGMTRSGFDALFARAGVRRWLRRVLIAWTGWLLLGAVVLNQPLMDGWINRKPDRVHVGWTFALSLVPGHVIAWGVTVRGHGRDIAWGATARRAHTWFVPWSLLRKEIHLAGLRATGVAVDIRRSKATLPPPPPRQRPWTFRMSGKAAKVRSLSLWRQLQVTGVGRAGVEFRKVLSGGEIELRQGWVNWKSIEVAIAGQPWATEGHLQAGVTLAPFIPSRSNAAQKMAALSLTADLEASLPGWHLDPEGLRRESGLPEQGQLTLHLAVDQGEVSELSEFSLRQPVKVTDEDGITSRELTAAMRLEDQRLLLAVDLPRGAEDGVVVSARLSAPWTAPARLGQWQAEDRGLGLAEALAGDASGRVELSLPFRSLAALRPWLSRWRGLEADGRGWAHLDLTLEAGEVSPQSILRFDKAELEAALLGHRGRASIDGALERLPGAAMHYRLRLRAVEIATEAGDTVLSDADAELEIVGKDNENLLVHPPSVLFRMRDASVPDLRVFNGYLPGAAVAIGAGDAKVSLELTLDPETERASGQLNVDAPEASVTFSGMALAGRLSLATTLRDADLEHRRADVTGTRLLLDGVRFDDAGGIQVRNWRLEANVDQAEAVLGAPVQVQGTGQLVMSDLKPILAIYSRVTDYPPWLLRLADAGEVRAKGRFAVDGATLGLTEVHGENDRFELDARLALAEGSKRGALLVQWGPLALGVGLGGADAGMHLVGARAWFEDRAD
jgi:hypothetical protein